jgi:hypothetical protein
MAANSHLQGVMQHNGCQDGLEGIEFKKQIDTNQIVSTLELCMIVCNRNFKLDQIRSVQKSMIVLRSQPRVLWQDTRCAEYSVAWIYC